MSRRDELRALVREHALTYAQVADLASAKVKSVECWLAGPESKKKREPSQATLDLIRMRLAGREKGTK